MEWRLGPIGCPQEKILARFVAHCESFVLDVKTVFGV